MKSLKYALRNEWYNIILLVLPFIIIPFVWDALPDQIPTHWNLQGEPDDYSSKLFGVLFLPLLNIGLYLLTLNLDKIDPKRRITIGQKPIPMIRTLLVVFLFFMYCWMLSVPLGNDMISFTWFFPAVAILFLVMGNYLRTIQPNYFIGVRVPWALEDDDNWRRTHRFSGYLWVAGGLLLLLLFPFFATGTYTVLFLTSTVLMALIPVIYSFYIYKSQT